MRPWFHAHPLRIDLSGVSPVSPLDQARSPVFGSESRVSTPSRMPRVALCGPIAAPQRAAQGGYEAANRRTVDALVRRGVPVLERPYPPPQGGRRAALLRYAACFARHAVWLMTQRERYDVLHLTPLNMRFAPAELLLIAAARLARRPVLMDVRAGTFVRHYGGAGALYRRVIDAELALADRVAVEARDYMPFVEQRTRQAPFYFPNYASTAQHEGLAGERPGPGPDGVLRLVYFGRLVPEKGLDIVLQTTALLAAQGLRVRLDLIGEGPHDYLLALRRQHANLPVCWHGGLAGARLTEVVRGAHFFLFPSRHDGEGHSNALNEAMALGVVPICSRQGFSASVVEDAGAVLPVDAPASSYATAVTDVLTSGRWSDLSRRAVQRVQAHFSEEATLPALITVYRDLVARRRKA
jgi:glycosyltransferase involved in cell wall biosynthesis